MVRRVVDIVIGVAVATGLVTALVWLLEINQPAIARTSTPRGQDPVEQSPDLLARLDSKDSDELIEALVEAARVVQPSEELVDKVLENGMSRDQYVRLAAMHAMGHMGEALNSRLQHWLEHPDPDRFLAGCVGVQAQGTAGVRWLEQVRAGLKSDVYASRMAALFALEAMGPGAEPALDEVIAMLREPEFNIQQVACRVIRAIGPAASRAAPELVRLIDEGVVSARTRALIALAAIGPVEGIDTVGILRKWVQAYTVTDRERSLEALAIMGPAASDALEDVKLLMRDERRSVMPQAAYAYYRITGDRDTALSALMKLLPNYDTRTAAMDRIGAMGSAADEAVESIAEYLTNDEAPTRETALFALSAIGPGARRAVAEIRRMADRDEDPLLRAQASELLQRLAADGEAPADR